MEIPVHVVLLLVILISNVSSGLCFVLNITSTTPSTESLSDALTRDAIKEYPLEVNFDQLAPKVYSDFNPLTVKEFNFRDCIERFLDVNRKHQQNPQKKNVSDSTCSQVYTDAARYGIDLDNINHYLYLPIEKKVSYYNPCCDLPPTEKCLENMIDIFSERLKECLKNNSYTT